MVRRDYTDRRCWSALGVYVVGWIFGCSVLATLGFVTWIVVARIRLSDADIPLALFVIFVLPSVFSGFAWYCFWRSRR